MWTHLIYWLSAHTNKSSMWHHWVLGQWSWVLSSGGKFCSLRDSWKCHTPQTSFHKSHRNWSNSRIGILLWVVWGEARVYRWLSACTFCVWCTECVRSELWDTCWRQREWVRAQSGFSCFTVMNWRFLETVSSTNLVERQVTCPNIERVFALWSIVLKYKCSAYCFINNKLLNGG